MQRNLAASGCNSTRWRSQLPIPRRLSLCISASSGWMRRLPVCSAGVRAHRLDRRTKGLSVRSTIRTIYNASRRIAALSIACGVVLSMRCNAAVVIKKENAVEVIKSGAAAAPATEGLVLVVQDKLGTGESSRAVLKMSAGWNARIDEETLIEITRAGIAALDRQMMTLGKGQVFFYSREAKGEWRIQTPAGTGTGRGTQLVIRVLLDGSTFFQLIEGEFDFGNPHGTLALKPGEAGE